MVESRPVFTFRSLKNKRHFSGAIAIDKNRAFRQMAE
jgi:hypothetical protein